MASNIFLVFVICIAIILNNFNYSEKWEVCTWANNLQSWILKDNIWGDVGRVPECWVGVVLPLGIGAKVLERRKFLLLPNVFNVFLLQKAQMGHARHENTCSFLSFYSYKPQLKLSAKFTYIQQSYPLAQIKRQRKMIFFKVYFCRLYSSFMEHVKSWSYCPKQIHSNVQQIGKYANHLVPAYSNKNKINVGQLWEMTVRYPPP